MAATSPWNRRQFLEVSGLTVAAATFGGLRERAGKGTTGAPKPPAGGVRGNLEEPSTKISGSLSILLWSHFVPSADTWFDSFAKDSGQRWESTCGVDHIALADVPAQSNT